MTKYWDDQTINLSRTRTSGKNTTVFDLQIDLILLGYAKPSNNSFNYPDGAYGPTTEAAVKDFQRDTGLVTVAGGVETLADGVIKGVVNYATAQKIKEVYATRLASGELRYPANPTSPSNTDGNKVRVLRKAFNTMGFNCSVKSSKWNDYIKRLIKTAQYTGRAFDGTPFGPFQNGPPGTTAHDVDVASLNAMLSANEERARWGKSFSAALKEEFDAGVAGPATTFLVGGYYYLINKKRSKRNVRWYYPLSPKSRDNWNSSMGTTGADLYRPNYMNIVFNDIKTAYNYYGRVDVFTVDVTRTTPTQLYPERRLESESSEPLRVTIVDGVKIWNQYDNHFMNNTHCRSYYAMAHPKRPTVLSGGVDGGLCNTACLIMMLERWDLCTGASLQKGNNDNPEGHGGLKFYDLAYWERQNNNPHASNLIARNGLRMIYKSGKEDAYFSMYLPIGSAFDPQIFVKLVNRGLAAEVSMKWGHFVKPERRLTGELGYKLDPDEDPPADTKGGKEGGHYILCVGYYKDHAGRLKGLIFHDPDGKWIRAIPLTVLSKVLKVGAGRNMIVVSPWHKAKNPLNGEVHVILASQSTEKSKIIGVPHTLRSDIRSILQTWVGSKAKTFDNTLPAPTGTGAKADICNTTITGTGGGPKELKGVVLDPFGDVVANKNVDVYPFDRFLHQVSVPDGTWCLKGKTDAKGQIWAREGTNRRLRPPADEVVVVIK